MRNIGEIFKIRRYLCIIIIFFGLYSGPMSVYLRNTEV